MRTHANTPATLEDAIRNLAAVDAEHDTIRANHSGAEAGWMRLERAFKEAAATAEATTTPPTELVIPNTGVTKTVLIQTFADGTVVETNVGGAVDKVLSSRDAIIKHCAGDPDKAAPLFAALKRWNAAKASARRKAKPAGYDAAKAAFEADEAAWGDWLERQGAAQLAVLNAPARSAGDIHRKLQAYLTSNNALVGPDGQISGQWVSNVDIQRALEAAMRDLAQADPIPPTTPERRAWVIALSEFEAAQRATRAADTAWENAHAAALLASSPAPDLASGRYPSEDSILIDRSLTPLQRLELVRAFHDWRPRWEAAYDVHRLQELSGASERAYARLFESLTILNETPAPDAAAAAFKLQHELASQHGLKPEAMLDPAEISRLLTVSADEGDRTLLLTYLDLLRLSGASGPITEAAAFDARGWLAEFEARPAYEVCQFGPKWIEGRGEAELDRAHWNRWEALMDWQKRAVRSAAKERDEASNSTERRALVARVVTTADAISTRMEVAA